MKKKAAFRQSWALLAFVAIGFLLAGGPNPTADSLLLKFSTNADPAIALPAASVRLRIEQAGLFFEKKEYRAGLDSLRKAIQPALELPNVAPFIEILTSFYQKTPADSVWPRARFQQNIGYLWQQSGANHLAFPRYANALDLFLKTTDAKNTGRTAMNLANIHGDWGDFQQKLDLLDLAQQKSRSARDSANLVNVFTNLGNTWLENLENPDSAIVFYQKAIDVFGTDRTGQPTVFTARCFFYKKDPKNSRAWLEKLKKLPGALEDEQVASYAEQTSAELAARAGDLVAARLFFQKKLAGAESTGARIDAARMAFYLGELENSAEKPASALDFYRKAIGFLRIDPEKPDLLLDTWAPKILFAEAAMLEKTGDPRAAIAEYLRGFGSLGAMRRRAVSDNSKFRLADEQRVFCERAMPTVHAFFEKNPTDSVAIRGLLAVIGYAKSSALFDGAQRAFAQNFSRLPREKQLAERMSLGALAGFERQVLEEKDPVLRKKWADSCAFYRGRLAEMERGLTEGSPIYEKLKQFDYPLNCPIAAIQNRLDTGQLMLDYLIVGDSALFTTAVSCSGLKSWKTALPVGFSATCTSFRRALSDGDWSADSAQTAYLKNAPRLFELLVRPALTAFPGAGRLQFVADGPLHFLPFPALLTGPFSGNWTDKNLPLLCRDFAVSNAWSAVFPTDFFQKKGASSLDFGGFGADYRDPETWLSMHPEDGFLKKNDPKPLLAMAFRGGGLDSLPNADDEVDAISAFFGNQKTWLNKDCTKSNFEQNAGRCGILHIALHGSPLRDDGADFGLLFSKNEQVNSNILTAADVARLDLRAGLVVVSSCESGLGELKKGEGVLSLGRAFALSGCPAAVVNLWKADDFSSKTIMVAFYEGLKNGLPKDVALQKAWLAYLQNASSVGARPGFWANFELIGDVSPIEKGGAGGLSKIWLAIGAAAAAVAAWLFFRKKK